MGNVVKHSITGDYFLSTKAYSGGAKNFHQEVIENPDSALTNYYYGRFLLGDKQYKEALPYLKKATSLDSDNPNYHFWLGVVYGSMVLQTNLWVNLATGCIFLSTPPFWIRGVDRKNTALMLQKVM